MAALGGALSALPRPTEVRLSVDPVNCPRQRDVRLLCSTATRCSRDLILGGSTTHDTSSSSTGTKANARRSGRECLVLDLSESIVPYDLAWAWQKGRLADVVSHLPQRESPPGPGEEDSASSVPDTVLLLQHSPVYTLGTGSSREHLKFPVEEPPAPLFVTERGGEVTYHGPGQLVVYPILDLRRHRKDLHWYLRSLEETLIQGVREGFGIEAERVPGMTGVWADGRKLAAIGIRVSRWVAYHGVALNLWTDLRAFEHIVPCGLSLPVGSVKGHLDRRNFLLANENGSSGVDVAGSVSDQELMRTAVGAFLQAFSVVFDMDLVYSEEEFEILRRCCSENRAANPSLH